MRAFVGVVVGVLLVVPGCASSPAPGTDEAGVDGGALDGALDSGGASDGATADAADARADVGPLDASVDLDGAAMDAEIDGSAADAAGASDDAPTSADASDAGAPVDGGGSSDAGGGADAGASDAGAGSDAGASLDAPSAFDAAATTCAIRVSPTSATAADDFVVTVASNGTSCSVRFDGGSPLSVPCDVSASFAGSFFGLGSHGIELVIGDGPSGPSSCSASFTVTAAPDAGPVDAGPGVTTCAVSIDPPGGTTADTFTLRGASNGSGCTASVDGGAPISIPCTASFPTRFPAGTHVVVLTVGAGPSGPTTCSASVTVTEAPDAGPPPDAGTGGTTTCTIDVTPSSGGPGTTFTITATSNGSMCTARLDGTTSLATPCSGTSTFMGSIFGPGTHTLELLVGAGPGGATSCSDTFVITP